MFLNLRLMFALLGLGVAFSFMGYREWKQAATVKADPDAVACAVFESRGPLDNDHVQLSGFNVTEDMYFAYEESEYGSSYSTVLIPVYPLNRTSDPKNEDLRVILQFPNVAGDEDLVRLVDQDTVTGIAGSMGSSLHHEFRGLLDDGYPGIQLDKCYVVKVNQRLPSQSRGFGMMAFGGTAILAFAGIIAWGYSSDHRDSSGGTVDTAAADYMSRRLPTEFDAAKFQSTTSNGPQTNAELIDSAQPDEMQSYQREFEERYGISPSHDEQPSSI